jgi:hypothetical protein
MIYDGSLERLPSNHLPPWAWTRKLFPLFSTVEVLTIVGTTEDGDRPLMEILSSSKDILAHLRRVYLNQLKFGLPALHEFIVNHSETLRCANIVACSYHNYESLVEDLYRTGHFHMTAHIGPGRQEFTDAELEFCGKTNCQEDHQGWVENGRLIVHSK